LEPEKFIKNSVFQLTGNLHFENVSSSPTMDTIQMEKSKIIAFKNFENKWTTKGIAGWGIS